MWYIYIYIYMYIYKRSLLTGFPSFSKHDNFIRSCYTGSKFLEKIYYLTTSFLYLLRVILMWKTRSLPTMHHTMHHTMRNMKSSFNYMQASMYMYYYIYWLSQKNLKQYKQPTSGDKQQNPISINIRSFIQQ